MRDGAEPVEWAVKAPLGSFDALDVANRRDSLQEPA
jgi:hypothetical protein